MSSAATSMIHRRQEGEKTGLPASSLRSSLPRRPRGAVDREMFTRQEKKEVDDIDGVLCATEEEGGEGEGRGKGRRRERGGGRKREGGEGTLAGLAVVKTPLASSSSLRLLYISFFSFSLSYIPFTTLKDISLM